MPQQDPRDQRLGIELRTFLKKTRTYGKIAMVGANMMTTHILPIIDKKIYFLNIKKLHDKQIMFHVFMISSDVIKTEVQVFLAHP